MFLTYLEFKKSNSVSKKSQSPQIGSMFLTSKAIGKLEKELKVAIPSNRANVSYGKVSFKENKSYDAVWCRNPLKSGQCFLPKKTQDLILCFFEGKKSQSPQIGSMFLTKIKRNIKRDR